MPNLTLISAFIYHFLTKAIQRASSEPGLNLEPVQSRKTGSRTAATLSWSIRTSYWDWNFAATFFGDVKRSLAGGITLCQSAGRGIINCSFSKQYFCEKVKL